jgi:hypothetical protein
MAEELPALRGLVRPVAHQSPDEFYKLAKYLCRPSTAGTRVTDQQDGRFRVELKTAWRDGTTAELGHRAVERARRILVGWLGQRR